MWLNVTIYGQSEIYRAVRQLEIALLQLTQQIDELIAIQCAIQGDFSVKLNNFYITQYTQKRYFTVTRRLQIDTRY